MPQSTTAFLLTSTPALAAALRSMATPSFRLPSADVDRRDALVPMYQLQANMSGEAEAAAHLVSNIADRLRRLADAYGEWALFDAPAYFDLSYNQAERLVRLVERVSTVHIVFFVDQLLPSFQQAAHCWSEQYALAYGQLRQGIDTGELSFGQTQTLMLMQWQQLLQVLQGTRQLLANDIGFLATNGAEEERNRWRTWWSKPPARGLDIQLTPALHTIPTLTLSFDFPLPTHRQPDRLRRLRGNRERRRGGRSYLSHF
jgi:hypothetical protein